MFNPITRTNKKISKSLPITARREDNSVPVVMIVEDDADSRLMLRLLLETWKYRVVEATNGIEALYLAEKETLDLILMDVKMPRLDGFETARCLRASGRTDYVPIVFLSGCAEEAYRRASFDVGANEYLIKPINYEFLEKILDRYTNNSDKVSIQKKVKYAENFNG